MLIHTYILTHICVRIRARIHLARAHVCMHLHLHAYMQRHHTHANPISSVYAYKCIYLTSPSSLHGRKPRPVIREANQIIYDYLIWFSLHIHITVKDNNRAWLPPNNPFLTTLCFYVCVYEYTYLTSLPLHTPEPTTCVIGEVSQIIYDYLIWLSLQVDMVVKMITWSGFRSTHLGLSQPHPVDGWIHSI